MVLVLLTACAPVKPDRDQDGYSGVDTGADRDCDDDDATRAPGAAEACNGLDDDCDGDVDEGATVAGFVDADGDTWGADPAEGCAEAAGFTLRAGDCDDGDAAVYPGATDVCGDGVDADCTPSGCRQSGVAEDERALRFRFEEHAGVGSVLYGWPDLDGDGRGDVAFADWYAGAPGQLLVVLTAAEDWVEGGSVSDTEAWQVLDAADRTWRGAWAWHRPEPNLVLGARTEVAVYAAADLASPLARYAAAAGSVDLGTPVRALGDLDGDGLDEVGVSDVSAMVQGTTSDGRVWILRGDEPLADAALEDAALHIDGARARLGLGVALAAGDADGDGVADLYASAGPAYTPSGHGAVYVFRLGDAPTSTDDAWSVVSHVRDAAGDFGARLVVDDWSGDAFADLVVSAPDPWSYTSGGALLWAPGPLPAYGILELDDGAVFAEGPAPTRALGVALEGLDFDGDRLPDVLTSEAGGDPPGFAWVGYGAPPGQDRLLFEGSPADAWFADGLAAVPDANGDGTDEVLLSVDGAARLWFGRGE